MYCAIHTGEAENPEDRVGINLNFSIMKKLKFVLGSTAFLVAIAGAFASKMWTPPANAEAFHPQTTLCTPESTVEQDCSSLGTGDQCTVIFSNNPDPQPAWQRGTTEPCSVALRRPGN